MQKIDVNYEQMSQIGGKFSQQQAELKTMLENIRAQVEDLRAGGWLGDTANAFYQEMDNLLLPALERLHKSMDMANVTVDRISSDFKKAESDCQPQVTFRI